ncbi:hypothetical protein P280DRAFT_130412 [Massarina eburnea CBS 473.64]|uniref:Uncharacterized protein n=1 Tax=Massarina eburnea CBS 473.64 TaxID=1395130 RepID=A0A6A6SFI4_9PLEO|nr:hypothetical protein P280DRAFT_130412 [Massarina eburnea CBS 473.64]
MSMCTATRLARKMIGQPIKMFARKSNSSRLSHTLPTSYRRCTYPSASIHDNLVRSNPSIVTDLGNDDNPANSSQITLPFAAFDLQARWPIYPNSTPYFPMRRVAQLVTIHPRGEVNPKPGLSAGAIAGIAIGAVAVLCLIPGLLFFYGGKRRCARRRSYGVPQVDHEVPRSKTQQQHRSR